MARNEIFISVPPREVFAVLSDPRSYSHWVVGSREVRSADREWPRQDSRFEYGVGFGPLRHGGVTRVISATPPVRLELHIHAFPLPDGRAILDLQPEGAGTRATIVEEPASRLLSLLAGPLGHGAIRLRNRESLIRLKELAEGTTPPPRGDLAERGGAVKAPPVRSPRHRMGSLR